MMPTRRVLAWNGNAQGAGKWFRNPAGWMIVLFVLFAVSGACEAYERDPAQEAEFHSRLEGIAPEAVDYFIMATQAMDNQDTKGARENFARVLDYAPDFVPALRRMSYVVEDVKEVLRLANRAYEL